MYLRISLSFCSPTCLPTPAPASLTEYGCYHPLRDVLAPPFERRAEQFMNNSLKQGLDEVVAGKKS